MPWVTLGAAAISALSSSSSSSKARKAQQQAAAAAQALRERMYLEGKDLQMPYYNSGTRALSTLDERLPELTAGYDPIKLLTEPGYEFGRQQGQKALEQSLAAKGLNVSGQALKDAAQWGNDYATTKLDDAFNRDRTSKRDVFDMLMGVAGTGQRAGENIAGAGNAFASGGAEDIYGRGNAGAADSLAQGRIWSNLLNQGASWFKNRDGGGEAKTGNGAGTVSDGTGITPKRYLADGGAVVAGAPAEVLDPIEAAWCGMAHGGAVHGAAAGKTDGVAAMLSPGEHVVDAEVVSMLGDGNSEAGHALLEELKQRVRATKRATPASRPAAAMAGA